MKILKIRELRNVWRFSTTRLVWEIRKTRPSGSFQANDASLRNESDLSRICNACRRCDAQDVSVVQRHESLFTYILSNSITPLLHTYYFWSNSVILIHFKNGLRTDGRPDWSTHRRTNPHKKMRECIYKVYNGYDASWPLRMKMRHDGQTFWIFFSFIFFHFYEEVTEV